MKLLDINGITRDLDNFYRSFWYTNGNNTYHTSIGYDWFDNVDNYTMSVDLPGVSREEIEISVVDNVVNVTTAKGARRQYSLSSTVPRGANVEELEAKLDLGVLTLSVPKTNKPKQLTVKVK